MKPFPIDIWTIKENSIEKWSENFFWPVTIQEFEDIEYKMQNLFITTITQAPSEIEDALWVIFNWNRGLYRLFYAYLLIHRLHQKGLSPVFKQNSPDHRSSLLFYQPVLNSQSLAGWNLGRELPLLTTWTERIYDAISLIIHELLNLSSIPKIFKQFKDGNFISTELSAANTHKRDWFANYAKIFEKDLLAVKKSWLMPIRLKNDRTNCNIETTISNLLEGYLAIAKQYNIEISSLHLSELNSLFCNAISYVMVYTEHIQKALRKRNQTSILSAKLGNTFIRCLNIAAKREGFTRIGFTHGNLTGIMKTSSIACTLMALLDKFIVTTSEGAENLQKLSDEMLSPLGKKVEVSFARDPHYEKISNDSYSTPLKMHIQTIMVLEDSPYQQFLPWPFYFDFQIRLANSLSKLKGMKKIMKRHPEALKESDGLWNNYFDELCQKPFEQVYSTADAYLFTHTGTTAFGIALLTNRPIIMFEHLLDLYFPNVLELLKKRCHVISSWYDENGRIMFNEEQLIEVLHSPVSEPDKEILKYFF